ncbi:serine/threonine protein phosphatase 1 [Gillisia sp. Hel1_33_143]|uniref:metallophosphoesterase family protein n=1 Tax=Gillisia sp. Hel1_33_143 TaxID=1336796 RepID=UPI00087C9F89|nr:metallophosphoesterase family protein [Gillisia sp. Hel1_33_143]SDR83301.1 serine/threonine protein phosphatase 1 [Gillisia sp. Hel1_33_143]
MKRTIAIGDIHGGLKALIQLIERLELHKEDHLIFLGDYVDGWSDSAKVISYLIALNKDHHCTFLRGNHDDLVYRWLKTGEKNKEWLQHGGVSSIEAYKNISIEERKEHLHFYEQMHNYYVDNENRLFVHAGFSNLRGPKHEHHETSFFWDRTLWETALALGETISKDHKYYPKRFLLFKEIFIGHTPVTRVGEDKPLNFANIWNVDTGAAFKGKLSAIDIKSKEIWQSDKVFTLYPEEQGRN